MSASASAASGPEIGSRRLGLRHNIEVALDVIVLRSGIPDSIPGRCTDISEGGIGAAVAGELALNQPVAIELKLPNVAVPLRVRASVRHHSRLHCGLQFVNLSAEQREMIRYWVHRREAQVEIAAKNAEAPAAPASRPEHRRGRKIRIRKRSLLVLLLFVLVLAALGWWYWQTAWSKLERSVSVRTAAEPATQNFSASANDVPRRSLREINGSPSSCQSIWS